MNKNKSIWKLNFKKLGALIGLILVTLSLIIFSYIDYLAGYGKLFSSSLYRNIYIVAVSLLMTNIVVWLVKELCEFMQESIDGTKSIFWRRLMRAVAMFLMGGVIVSVIGASNLIMNPMLIFTLFTPIFAILYFVMLILMRKKPSVYYALKKYPGITMVLLLTTMWAMNGNAYENIRERYFPSSPPSITQLIPGYSFQKRIIYGWGDSMFGETSQRIYPYTFSEDNRYLYYLISTNMSTDYYKINLSTMKRAIVAKEELPNKTMPISVLTNDEFKQEVDDFPDNLSINHDQYWKTELFDDVEIISACYDDLPNLTWFCTGTPQRFVKIGRQLEPLVSSIVSTQGLIVSSDRQYIAITNIRRYYEPMHIYLLKRDE